MTATAHHNANVGAHSAAYSILIGLTTLAILLQGVWAGIFLSYENRPNSWINMHARGGEVAIGLCFLALIAAAVQLRSRGDLLVGTAVLLVLLIVEAYLGGRITDDGNGLLTAVHVPLALVLMGLAVWLPFRARSTRARTPESN
jgi:hypothetical protein